jgi:glycosyltransferase involved in cell wall biosynthesis
MRILFVTGEYPPLEGGVGAYTAALGSALVAQGAQVGVLTGARAQGDHPPGVAVHTEIGRWGPGAPRRAAALAREVGAEWIHVQYQTAAFAMNPAVNFAPPFWRRRGLRVAWTYHDLLPPYLFPKAGRTLRSWVTRRPAHGADLVVVTNEGDRRALDADAQAGRIACLAAVPIGSNVAGRVLSAAERAAQRALYGYTNDQTVIGYFGFLNRSKGGATLVRTLRALRDRGLDAHLLMIGEPFGASDPTNRAYGDEIAALIGELGLTERVRWTGRRPDDAVGADLNALDVLLLPYEDGASLRRGTLMAGLANGCAIVTTTPQAPMPELAGGRDLLYVPPGDPAAAAEAVLSLVADPARAAALRRAALAAARQFTWETIAREHLRLYASGSNRITV